MITSASGSEATSTSSRCSCRAFACEFRCRPSSSAHLRRAGVQNRRRRKDCRGNAQRFGLLADSAGRGGLCVVNATAETETEEEVQIEGIDRSYCDEFVCTSSPQVEQNIKAVARDTTRLSTWTTSLFRKDVQYKDAFLAFKGTDKYKRLKFVKDVVGNPKVLVTKLRMLDKGKARVEWRLRGSVAVFPVDIDFSSEFELDLITGRIFSHSETWDLSRLSPQSKLAFTVSRVVWSLGIRGANAGDDSSSLLKRFRKDDEPQGNITADPMDPTKFFQNEDPSKDLFSIGLIIAFIWLIYQAYGEIEKL